MSFSNDEYGVGTILFPRLLIQKHQSLLGSRKSHLERRLSVAKENHWMDEIRIPAIYILWIIGWLFKPSYITMKELHPQLRLSL